MFRLDKATAAICTYFPMLFVIQVGRYVRGLTIRPAAQYKRDRIAKCRLSLRESLQKDFTSPLGRGVSWDVVSRRRGETTFSIIT